MNNSIFKIFGFLLLIPIIIIFLFGFNSYTGTKFYYIIFSIISNFSLYFCFGKNRSFFEKIFGLFFWLGFWFKFSLQISFLQNSFPEGVGLFDFKSSSFDKLIFIVSFANLSFILTSVLREKFFNFNSSYFFLKIGISI